MFLTQNKCKQGSRISISRYGSTYYHWDWLEINSVDESFYCGKCNIFIRFKRDRATKKFHLISNRRSQLKSQYTIDRLNLNLQHNRHIYDKQLRNYIVVDSVLFKSSMNDDSMISYCATYKNVHFIIMVWNL